MCESHQGYSDIEGWGVEGPCDTKETGEQPYLISETEEVYLFRGPRFHDPSRTLIYLSVTKRY